MRIVLAAVLLMAIAPDVYADQADDQLAPYVERLKQCSRILLDGFYKAVFEEPTTGVQMEDNVSVNVDPNDPQLRLGTLGYSAAFKKPDGSRGLTVAISGGYVSADVRDSSELVSFGADTIADNFPRYNVEVKVLSYRVDSWGRYVDVERRLDRVRVLSGLDGDRLNFFNSKTGQPTNFALYGVQAYKTCLSQ